MAPCVVACTAGGLPEKSGSGSGAGAAALPRTVVPAGAFGLNEELSAGCWGDLQAHAVHHHSRAQVVLHTSRRVDMRAMWGRALACSCR